MTELNVILIIIGSLITMWAIMKVGRWKSIATSYKKNYEQGVTALLVIETLNNNGIAYDIIRYDVYYNIILKDGTRIFSNIEQFNMDEFLKILEQYDKEKENITHINTRK